MIRKPETPQHRKLRHGRKQLHAELRNVERRIRRGVERAGDAARAVELRRLVGAQPQGGLSHGKKI